MTKDKYALAKLQYENIGVNIDEALKILDSIPISIHCWQGDDVKGFMKKDSASGGGIAVTGKYPGRARNAKELMDDLAFVLKLLPGKKKINLHAIYLDTDEDVDLDEIEPKHFASWVEWAKKHNVGLDFNPTLFGHPLAETGFTLSSTDENIRKFWIEHCKRCRKIGEYFGKELNQKSVVNIWIPDGYKDYPYNRIEHRRILKESLDEIFAEKLDKKYLLDTVESKLFGLGVEGYTTGSHEFYLSYAIKNNVGLCLDSGHFHPTESIADKLPAIALFLDDILLHVSRPMRWDSDHVVIQDDELFNITSSIVRNNLLDKIHIGLDFFDGSINHLVAWVVGVRSTQKALLRALLEPIAEITAIEKDGKFSKRLALTEELKTLPYGLVYDYYLEKHNIANSFDWLNEVEEYTRTIQKVRG